MAVLHLCMDKYGNVLLKAHMKFRSCQGGRKFGTGLLTFVAHRLHSFHEHGKCPSRNRPVCGVVQ